VRNDDWKIYSIILNKERVNKNLRTSHGKRKLYNFLSRVLIEELAPLLKETREKVELVVDRSKNKEEIKDFNHYLTNQLQAMLPLNVPLNIYHLNSFQTCELQAVDLFSWGIFRKFEFHDLEWYNCFSHKIDCEMEYLK
jgi:hypothetical protein